jgi:hypothetical protein
MRAIDTGNLILEPQTAEHANEMFVVLSDPAIYEYENQPPPSLEWCQEGLRLLLRPPLRMRLRRPKGPPVEAVVKVPALH